MLLFPFPGMFEELLAGEVALAYTLGGKFCHHLCLSGYGGVVGAGHPEGVFAQQTCATYEDILDGVVEHVTHVEYAGHVWRGYYYGVRLARIGFGVKQAMLQPVGIPLVLHGFGVVFRG